MPSFYYGDFGASCVDTCNAQGLTASQAGTDIIDSPVKINSILAFLGQGENRCTFYQLGSDTLAPITSGRYCSYEDPNGADDLIRIQTIQQYG